MAALTIENITKTYGTTPVLNNISATVASGEFFTLLGPSGCGKTTLLRMIAGFLQQNEGTIKIGGEALDSVPAHKRDIGMVFQDYAIFPHLKVADNVAFGLKARKVARPDIETRVSESLKMVHLSGLGERFPAEMSGGQQQRIGLARAMAIQPRLLLMDEPLSNLDAKLRIELREDIRDLQKRFGITTIYVTHDQEEALAISDRICVMHGGNIEQIGTPYDIYRNPQRKFVASFVGAMNFIDGSVRRGTIYLQDTPTPMRCSSEDGPVTLAIRPENVLLESPGGIQAIATDGTLRKATYLGREANFIVTTGYGEIVAQIADPHHDFANTANTAVRLSMPVERFHVFSANGDRIATTVAPEQQA